MRYPEPKTDTSVKRPSGLRLQPKLKSEGRFFMPIVHLPTTSGAV